MFIFIAEYVRDDHALYHAATFRLLWEESSTMSEEEFKKWYAGEKEYYEELEDEAKHLVVFAFSYEKEVASEKQKLWQRRYERSSLFLYLSFNF